jgi:metal-responsive CopG/Arc/MetJ family transcriptional regulator
VNHLPEKDKNQEQVRFSVTLTTPINDEFERICRRFHRSKSAQIAILVEDFVNKNSRSDQK